MKDGHGGVVLGSEMSGGIRNVFVEDCQMGSPNLVRAIRLKSNSSRGGYLESLFVRNIQSTRSKKRWFESTCTTRKIEAQLPHRSQHRTANIDADKVQTAVLFCRSSRCENLKCCD